jgi:hypothetical protein
MVHNEVNSQVYIEFDIPRNMRSRVAIILPLAIATMLLLGMLVQQTKAQSPDLQAASKRGYKNGYSWGVYDKQHGLKYYAHNTYKGNACRALLPNCYYQLGFNNGYHQGYVNTPRPR